MSPIEVKRVSPEEMIREIETSVKLQRENKYAFQVGLKDLDFDINQELIDAQGLALPFKSLGEAERALNERVIVPVKLIEYDDTEHVVIEFDPRVVGFSGFMDCVTHSLALTNHGLFEIGRYPAVNLASQSRYWQWFLHRRWATPEEVVQIQESYQWSSQELLAHAYEGITGLIPEDQKEGYES
jgi:hypothetical protein